MTPHGLIQLLSTTTPLETSLLPAFWFLAAALLLDVFDVSMPRGDSIGGAGALCSAALIILGPATTAVIALASAVIGHALRKGPGKLRRLATATASRAIALLAGVIVFELTSSRPASLLSFTLVPAVFLLTEITASQAMSAIWTGRPLLRSIRGNLDSQAPLVAAQWSVAVLLLLTYQGMSTWALVPAVALLLLMRQSYVLFLDIRETYRTTVEVLVEAAESQDVRRVGHSDRTAIVARSIAMNYGLSANQVELISYAALLHDLGELAAEPPAEDGSIDAGRAPSADIVHGVEFFRQIEPILRVLDGFDENSTDGDHLLAGLIVALASDIDAEYHPDVAGAHRESTLNRVAARVTPAVKARAVGAALRLGYRIPAVS